MKPLNILKFEDILKFSLIVFYCPIGIETLNKNIRLIPVFPDPYLQDSQYLWQL